MISRAGQSRQQRRQIQRQQQKSLTKQNNLEKEVSTQIKRIFNSILLQEELEEIARETNFINRRRQLGSSAMVAVLLLGCSTSQDILSLETMCSFLNKWFNISIKPQSLQARINSPKCAAFMKKVSVKVLMHEANKVMTRLIKKHSQKRLKKHLYKRILLQDSTVISLPDSVARIFKGCGGSASKAALKCDVIIDQVNHLIVRIKCISGKIPDSSMADDLIEHTQKGDLVIRDLGYFNIGNFLIMIKRDVKFISRLKKNVHLYLRKKDGIPINIIKHLETLGISSKGIDIEVFVGQTARIPMRLIGIKIPPEVAEIRRQRHKKLRKCEPSEELHEWNGYTIMITNIPKEKLSLGDIFKIYKIRWQIEIFFKNIKSYLRIDKFTGENKYRILTFIYTKLILTWIHSLIYAYAQLKVDKEVSKFKFTKWLKEEICWKRIFIHGDFMGFLEELEKDIRFLCKQPKRERTQRDEGNSEDEIAA